MRKFDDLIIKCEIIKNLRNAKSKQKFEIKYFLFII